MHFHLLILQCFYFFDWLTWLEPFHSVESIGLIIPLCLVAVSPTVASWNLCLSSPPYIVHQQLFLWLYFFEQDINFYFVSCFLLTNQVKVKQHVVDLQLQPLNIVLRKTLDLLQTKDPGEIFAEPVDTDEVGKKKQWSELDSLCKNKIINTLDGSTNSQNWLKSILQGKS